MPGLSSKKLQSVAVQGGNVWDKAGTALPSGLTRGAVGASVSLQKDWEVTAVIVAVAVTITGSICSDGLSPEQTFKMAVLNSIPTRSVPDLRNGYSLNSRTS